MPELLNRIVLAHGSSDSWQTVDQVMARVSMGGVEFTSRMQPSPLQDVEVTASAASPALTLAGFPGAGLVAHYQPNRVWIEGADGRLQVERSAPGTTFRSVRHWLWWDQLDVVYYCGVILWQALCLPFTLLRSGCEMTELEPVVLAGGERLYPLRVVLPGDIPGFAAEQTLYADAAGLVHRVDYAPQLYGSWVRVAQLLEGHEMFGGFVHATRRRTYLCLPNGQPLRTLALGWLDLDDVGVVRRAHC
ncbi:MAG: hypothetical protein WED00_10595 [Aquisalimonadaceae bacterium]